MALHPYIRLYPNKTTAPTVNDDVTFGYEQGDIWIDTVAQITYQCVDPADGAAVWTDLTSGAGGATWGSITGTLSSQTDLQSALDGKASVTEPIAAAHIIDTSAAHAGSAIGNTPSGNISSTDVQAALNELDTEKSATSHDHSGTYQPLDSDLTAIAGLTPTDDDIIQRKSGNWVSRTLAQLSTDLTELIQDIIGAMVSGNTESGIDVTYDDTGGKLNFDAQTNLETYAQPPSTDSSFLIGYTGFTTKWFYKSYGDVIDLLKTSLAQIGTVIPNDGWISKNADTWTRTGNHTFTVSGDVTATYRKGAKVKYKDGGSFEYGVIGSSSYSSPNTTVNLIPNTDYAMAAATITDRYISYIENPEGFPVWFNFTSTASRSGTNYTNVPTMDLAQWKTFNNQFLFQMQSTMNATPGGSGYQRYTVPVTIAHRATGNGMNLNSAYGLVVFAEVSGTEVRVFKYDGSSEAVASNIYYFNGSFEF